MHRDKAYDVGRNVVEKLNKKIARQQCGKKRMKQVGRIEVPQEAFLAVLELGD